MDLIIGNTYQFEYINDTYSNEGERFFKIRLVDSDNKNEFIVRPTKSQNTSSPNYYLYCKVTNIDENGFVTLEQDELALFKAIYKPNQIYTFVIRKELPLSNKGHRRAIIENTENNISHLHTFFNRLNKNIGEIVEYCVCIKEYDDHFTLNFISVDEEFDAFMPETIFKGIHHEEWKERFFDKLNETTDSRVSTHIKEIENKINHNNRLWIFDYIKCLLISTKLSDILSLDDIEKICILIKDIENWLLEESGLLNKFSPQKREETIRKSEGMIHKAECIMESISIIKNNNQTDFVQDIIDKLLKSGYIKDRNKIFNILFIIIAYDKELIHNNIINFSKLLEYSSKEIIDDDLVERIIDILQKYINYEKRLINKELKYNRNKDVDKSLLSNIIIGIGSLLNFYVVKNLDNDNEFSIKPNKLLLTLCKYLSYICSKEKSILLANKLLIDSNYEKKHYGIKGYILRNVQNDPDALADQILSFERQNRLNLKGRHVKDLHLNFTDDIFTIHKSNIKEIDTTESTCLYKIEGVPIHLYGPSTDSEWEKSDDILYYRDKWKELFDTEITDRTPDYTKIIISGINNNLKNLIFCHSIYEDYINGIIHSSGYCGYHFSCNDLTKIFERGLEFYAKINTIDNKYNFNIIENIMEFSNYMAENLDHNVSGLCLSINSKNKRTYFITENGITCSCITSYCKHVKEGDVCVLTVKASYEDNYFPIAHFVQDEDKVLNKEELLRNQLRMVSEYNYEKNDDEQNENVNKKRLNLINSLVDNYFHIYDDKVLRYNLYHMARLISLIEKNKLANYYTLCIQYIELMECFSTNTPVEFSISDIQWDENFRTDFPYLKDYIDMYNLIKDFGDVDDIDELYSLATNGDPSDKINKVARLSLASALIESVTNDKGITNQIREIARGEIDMATNGNHLPLIEDDNNEDGISFR
jgi:hypothetical protein